jgi:hypothetical protein
VCHALWRILSLSSKVAQVQSIQSPAHLLKKLVQKNFGWQGLREITSSTLETVPWLLIAVPMNVLFGSFDGPQL